MRRILALAGEFVGDIGGTLVASKGAVGGVLIELDELPGAIGDDVGGTQVIGVVEAEGAGGVFGREALGASKDIFRCRAGGGDFVGFPEVACRTGRTDFLDATAIPS